jgi:hypothetical protein
MWGVGLKLFFGVLIGMRCLQEIEEVLKVKLDGVFEKWGVWSL